MINYLKISLYKERYAGETEWKIQVEFLSSTETMRSPRHYHAILPICFFIFIVCIFNIMAKKIMLDALVESRHYNFI